jgi:hypothetical protein
MVKRIRLSFISFFFLTMILVTLNSGIVARGSSSNIMQAPVIDGVISLNEYSSTKSFDGGDYQLFWEVTDSTNITIGIIGMTTGWVAIGFDPTTQMLDADIIFAWVETNGTVVIFDTFSTGSTGPHPPDTDLGGSYDILSYNGSEDATSTTIEFSRLLSTGDQDYDKVIPSDGDIDIIWAYGTSDSFSQYHGSSRGSSFMTISSEQQTTTTDTSTSTTTTPTQTTTTTGTAPGLQGITLGISLIGLTIFYRRKRQ